MRVPVPDGSVVDLVARLKNDVTAEMIKEAVNEASKTSELSSIIDYQNQPIVSTDIIGNSHSSIFDSPFTQVIDGSLVKTVNWYDNEWGYSNRVVDLVSILSKL